MSSNNERWAVLKGFGIAPEKETKKWSDRQLDEALLNLRETLEAKHPSEVLDFYEPPLKERWKESDDQADADSQAPKSAPQTSTSSVSALREPDAKYDVSAQPRNVIYFGPPGTGKTHLLLQKFAEYTDAPEALDQDTWVESVVGKFGWRPVIAAALANLGRPARVPEIVAHPWVQAKARARGRSPKVQQTIWSYLQAHTPDDVATVRTTERRQPAIFTKSAQEAWALIPDWRQLDDESDDVLTELTQNQQLGGHTHRRYRVVTFHPSFTYEDFVRGIRPVADSADDTTHFRVVDGIFKQICDQARENPAKRYAIFIDEINRVNIAKVFGELISLIEINKRAVFSANGELVSGLAVQLPGAAEADVFEAAFGVPTNLDIYGTMNTADRSIALLDVALRRRFEFQSMEPDYSVVNLIVEGVHLGRLLERINGRIEYLLDRDHLIGHAYLMAVDSLSDLRDKFSTQIIPLLQEYFFEDMGRVASVLATAQAAPPMLRRISVKHGTLFSGQRPDGVAAERDRYVVTPEATWSADTFTGIYSAVIGGGGGTEIE